MQLHRIRRGCPKKEATVLCELVLTERKQADGRGEVRQWFITKLTSTWLSRSGYSFNGQSYCRETFYVEGALADIK